MVNPSLRYILGGHAAVWTFRAFCGSRSKSGSGHFINSLVCLGQQTLWIHEFELAHSTESEVRLKLHTKQVLSQLALSTFLGFRTELELSVYFAWCTE